MSATTVGGPGKGNPRGDGEPTWQRDQVSPYSPSPYFQTSWPQRTTGIRKDGLLELGKDILDTPAALSTVGSEDDDSLEDGKGLEEKEEEDSFEKEDSDADSSAVRKNQDISDIFNQVGQIAAKEEEIQDFNSKRGGPPFFQLLLLLSDNSVELS